MSNDEYNGKTISFADFLEKSPIEIPIIQRDYAQGREENTMIRLDFLNALKDSIVENRDIKLDFIYGNKPADAFLPLDGQQRLTTLFLLHWYAAIRCNEMTDSVKDMLCRFTYETRVSSREFCNDLVNNPVEIHVDVEKISEIIINSNWFFLSWKQDPTVRSMLSTLDDIHKLFYEIECLWEVLISDKRITFHCLTLKDFGLSDDLYIKMNARGRLLTAFENFKAGLQKRSTDNAWEDGIEFVDTFAFKVDTIWADFFWNNYQDKNNAVDNSQTRFITALVMNYIALDRAELSGQDRNQAIQRLNEAGRDSNLLPFITRDLFKYIYNCYEVYAKYREDNVDLKLNLEMWRHSPELSVFSEIVGAGITDSGERIGQRSGSSYTYKALFFAQTEYVLRAQNFNSTAFNSWMRVIRNVVSRGNIDSSGNRPDIVRSPDTFYGVINLINELAEGCDDIYKFLSYNRTKSSFAREQINEEIRKAKIITQRPDLKDLIWRTEDNELLRGRIAFVLDCIGYNDHPEDLDEALLSKVQGVFQTHFNIEHNLTDLFRRAMLTIDVDGAYDCYYYWWSRWSVVPNTTKRKLFVRYRELEFYIYSSEQSAYFKKLILMLIDNKYTDIINNFTPPADMPNWKTRLIKEDGLLRQHCSSCYIAISDDSSFCYLLRSQRPREVAGNLKII